MWWLFAYFWHAKLGQLDHLGHIGQRGTVYAPLAFVDSRMPHTTLLALLSAVHLLRYCAHSFRLIKRRLVRVLRG